MRKIERKEVRTKKQTNWKHIKKKQKRKKERQRCKAKGRNKTRFCGIDADI